MEYLNYVFDIDLLEQTHPNIYIRNIYDLLTKKISIQTTSHTF